MRIANEYNHLNAREYLMVNRPDQYRELMRALTGVNANDYLKISCDKAKLGQVFYSQSDINKALKQLLHADGWEQSIIHYYVTGDEETTRRIVNLTDKEEQKQIIEQGGFSSYGTYNQVDYQKDRISVEIQFGKYFSVAYDLHVKHTFFYARNDIDVGVEVIPTKAMEEHMDTGVPWFENEVTNVIREGRTNPPVPILMLGIEPDAILSREPLDYTDEELLPILRNTDISKYRSKYRELAGGGRGLEAARARNEKIERCLHLLGV